MRAMLTPSADDGPRFHSNMPVSELTERDSRAIEASVVSSAPSIAKTKDGVMHETRPTPIEPHGPQGIEPPNLRSRDQGLKVASRRTKARGKNADEP